MLNGLFALAMLLSIPCFILGLISPKIVRMKTRKQSSWVWFLVFLSSCTGLAVTPTPSTSPPTVQTKEPVASSPSPEPSTSPTAESKPSPIPKPSSSSKPSPTPNTESSPSPKPSPSPTENPYLKDFQSFKSDLDSIDSKAHGKLSQISEAIKKAENGDDSISLVDVIILANSAQDDLKEARHQLYRLDVPNSFPKSTREKCEKILDMIQIAYSKKESAMKNFVSAIDSGKPSEAAKTKQEIEEANQYLSIATLGILEVKSELGISLE